MNVDKIINAKSFVIIGANDKPGFGIGSAQGIAMSKDCNVYYLNPKRDVLLGKPCYKSLAELPEVPDCMVFNVPARAVNGYLEEGGKLGVKAAVVFASGFSEERSEQAQRLEQELIEICKRYDIALCGPNCVGFTDYIHQVSGSSSIPDFSVCPIERGCGIVAHSGYIMGQTQKSIPEITTCCVSVGNGAVCNIEDYMLYYALNDNIACIAAYMEGVGNPAVLEEALRIAAERRKPVVVLKSGKSQKGSYSAASHTGSMAGSFQTYEALFKKFGVILTTGFMEFVAAAKMFTLLDGKYPKSMGIGAINFSGGENTLCADICEKYNLALPDFEQKTIDVINSVIPSYSTAANPLDPTTTMFSEEAKVYRLFEAISQDESIGIITVGNDMGAVSQPKDITCVNVMSQLKKEGKLAAAFVIPTVEKTRNAELVSKLEKAGIPVLPTGDMAYLTLSHLKEFVEYDYTQHTLQLAIPETNHKDREIDALDEAASKEEIARYGVRVPKSALVTNADELKTALKEIPFPVVMKVCSKDILHKTEAGGVKLNIVTEEGAVDAFEQIMMSCKNYNPDADIEGILLQEMVPSGTEVIIGVKNDPQYGPLLLVGLGGVFVEVFKDAALYPCPLNREEAGQMLKSLKSYRLLQGYRGMPMADIDALIDIMVGVSDYAVTHKEELKEMDLNPVMVYEQGKGAVAVDALIIKYKD